MFSFLAGATPPVRSQDNQYLLRALRGHLAGCQYLMSEMVNWSAEMVTWPAEMVLDTWPAEMVTWTSEMVTWPAEMVTLSAANIYCLMS